MASILALFKGFHWNEFYTKPITCCHYHPNQDTTTNINDNNIGILLDPTKEIENFAYGVVIFMFCKSSFYDT